MLGKYRTIFFNKLNKLFVFIIGDINKEHYKDKVLKITSFFSFMFMLVSFFFNYSVHDNQLINISGIFLALVLFITFLFARFKYKYLPILYTVIIISLLSIVFTWKLFDGYDGAAFYILIILTLFFSIITRGVHSYISIFLVYVVLFGLTYYESLYPDSVTNYKDETARLNDIIFTVFLSITLVFAVVKFIFNKFLKHKDVYNLNKMLEEKNNTITEQNKKLEELNYTKDKFFSIIAHDLKNPLGSFKLLTEMLHESYKDFEEEELLELLFLMKTNSKNIFELLENLLEWSMAQRGIIKFVPTELNLYLTIENNIQLLQANSENKGITIKNNIKKSIFIYADINLLNTIFRNLITNAIKFSNKNDIVDISADTDENGIIVSIKDNGLGMSEEQITGLFKFESNHNTFGTNNEKGTGLGLILCKEFIEIHNGKIWVESKLGEGSKFFLLFPNKRNN